jgi:hypothetical protein
MSGPVLINLSGDIFGGSQVNLIVLNGTIGTMALTVDPSVEDSDVFALYIGGKLRLKEKNCAERRTGAPKGPASPKLVPVCDKVAP